MRRRVQPGGGRWEGTEVLDYKPPAGGGRAPFQGVTRQVLFDRPELAGQLRYFEVEAGGHSTLERHGHVHGVLVLRGRGACLVGSDVWELEREDLIEVPPMTWHQFRAAGDEALGFLCLVDAERDRPQLPTATDLAALRADPAVAAFIRP